jgi:hypothetical protein
MHATPPKIRGIPDIEVATAPAEVFGCDPLLDDLAIVAQLLNESPEDFQGPAVLFRNRNGIVESASVDEQLTCGRAHECNLRFPAEMREISRRHFTILREKDVFWLIDRGSRNQTRIRGRPIEKHELRDGDLINAGGVKFAFFKE